MMLVEDGKLSLDDPIGNHIAAAPESWKPITVRHLLTHTSGLSNNLYREINMRQDYTEADLLERIAALPLDFQPGERWSYSNPGYVILGLLIRSVTGRFYGDVLRERIFTPLGMHTARVISEADLIPDRAAGYRLVNGELKNQSWVAPRLNTTADGSLYMTVLDLAQWDAALDDERLLRRASLDQMWTPATLADGTSQPYGFGWSIGSVNGRRLIQHGGAWQGFTAHSARFVDDTLTIIVLMNLAGGDPGGSIAHHVAGLYSPALKRPERTAIQLDPRVFDAYVGEYELGPGMTLVISREGDRFYARPTNQDRVELFAESATEFFLTIVDAQLVFVRDASGEVTHLVLHQAGRHEARKMR
jgi:CubicO group peptidase (beta-lactamase class C family)